MGSLSIQHSFKRNVSKKNQNKTKNWFFFNRFTGAIVKEIYLLSLIKNITLIFQINFH